MRSLPKLIPGIHKKLPGDAQERVKGLYEHAEEHRTQLNLYITGEEEVEPEPDEMAPETLAAEATLSAVGGGRQHMEQATEGGSETARTKAAKEPAVDEQQGDEPEETDDG
jgi:hypothetical protein